MMEIKTLSTNPLTCDEGKVISEWKIDLSNTVSRGRASSLKEACSKTKSFNGFSSSNGTEVKGLKEPTNTTKPTGKHSFSKYTTDPLREDQKISNAITNEDAFSQTDEKKSSPSSSATLSPVTEQKKRDFQDFLNPNQLVSSNTTVSKGIFVQDLASSVLLQNYTILDILGSGKFGEVRLCRHNRTQALYALKVLRKDLIHKLGETHHIFNEKKVMEIVCHPFIIKLYSTFEDEANFYFLMEYVSGGELFQQICEKGKLSNDVARFYAAELVLAIEYLHHRNIIFRDLKPENVLLTTGGHIKVIDFGFAKITAHRTYSLCGTVEYMAPEIIQCKGHGPEVDWWSLGVFIYEMLAGYPSFGTENPYEVFQAIVKGKVEFPPYFSSDAIDLITKLLVVDPSKRLGANPIMSESGEAIYGGANQIKSHPWFNGIDWFAIFEMKSDLPSGATKPTGAGGPDQKKMSIDQTPAQSRADAEEIQEIENLLAGF